MANVVVIDDEEAVRRSLLNMLEQKGHNVLLAPNGVAGLQQCQDNDVDLAIVDIFMPEKNGLRTIHELQREDPAIKIIAISGGGDLGNLNPLILAEEAGIKHTLAKPFHLQDLLDAIQDLLPET